MSGRTIFRSPVFHRIWGWTADDLARITQVVRELDDTGTKFETAWGISDEGDPWFAVTDAATGNLMLHLACLDNTVTAVMPTFGDIVRARDLDAALTTAKGRLQPRAQSRRA